MKTLFILSNASSYGGGERSLETILPALATDYRIVIFAENERHYDRLLALAILAPDMCVIRLRGGKGISALARDLGVVWRHARRVPPAVFLANANKAALFGALLRRLLPGSPPAILFVRDFQWRNRRAIFRLAGAVRVIVPSEAVLQSAFWTDVLPAGTGFVIPNAVNLPPPAESAGTTDGRFVLCLANFARWKGVHLLVRALARADAHALGMRLVVAGSPHDPQYLEECRSLAQAVGLEDLIEFMPFVDAPERLYRECTMVVIPSLSRFGGPETFGRTVIEGWAHAKPVVAFAAGGPRYLIRNGADGYLVPEGDVDGLAARMRDLWSNKDRAERMGQAGRARALTEFSVGGVAKQVAAEIESAASAG